MKQTTVERTGAEGANNFKKPRLVALVLFLAGPFLLSVPGGDPSNPALIGIALLMLVWTAAFFSLNQRSFAFVRMSIIIAAWAWGLAFVVFVFPTKGKLSLQGTEILVIGGIGFLLLLVARRLLEPRQTTYVDSEKLQVTGPIIGSCMCCREHVSSEAHACPHCGQPSPFRQDVGGGGGANSLRVR